MRRERAEKHRHKLENRLQQEKFAQQLAEDATKRLEADAIWYSIFFPVISFLFSSNSFLFFSRIAFDSKVRQGQSTRRSSADCTRNADKDARNSHKRTPGTLSAKIER
jgi:hypothetical protein